MNTHRIRLCLATFSDGSWSCAGWGYSGHTPETDDRLIESARGGLEGPHEINFVEVDAPFPESKVLHSFIPMPHLSDWSNS